MADLEVFISSNLNVVILTALAGIFVLLALLFYQKQRETKQGDESVKEQVPARTESRTTTQPQKKKKGQEKKKDLKAQYLHPWLLTTLKGHSGSILDLDFNANGKYLATCADDRTVLLWNFKNISQKEHKSARVNVEFDHATKVKWSPDSKAFITATGTGNTIHVYKVGRKEDGTPGNSEHLLTFPDEHKMEIVNVGIACNGHFIMSITSDTSVYVWSLKGEVLAKIDTHHVNNYYGCVSPCGRFVASSGFTPDVKVWEVNFSKTGDFKDVKRAFELKGHTSGVYCFAFSNDSTRMASVSKDGTWKLWDTNIEYQKGQEPYLLTSANYTFSGTPSCLALSPDGRTVIIASGMNAYVYNGITGELNERLEEIHTEPVSALQFSPNEKYFVISVGKHARVFNNVAGFKNAVQDLEERKKKAPSQSIRERLQVQIDDARSTLKMLQTSEA